MKVNIGKGLELDVNVESIPANAMAHVVYIGLRNILMDAHASVTTDEADYVEKARAASEKKLAALMAGEVRVVSSREGDPVKAEAVRIASGIVKNAIRKKGGKLADYDAKAIRDAAVKLVETTPAILEQARANVEANKALAIDVDAVAV